jgi:hypothetical protein
MDEIKYKYAGSEHDRGRFVRPAPDHGIWYSVEEMVTFIHLNPNFNVSSYFEESKGKTTDSQTWFEIAVTLTACHQIGMETWQDFHTTKTFGEEATVGEINRWIKSVDSGANFSSAKISMCVE